MPHRRFDMHLVALLGLMAFECVFFYAQVAKQIVPFYPSRHDQLGYYSATFELLANFQVRGWRAFLDYLAIPTATGLTFVPQGALLALVGGGTRTAALSLNLIYFFALQAVLFQTVRARTRDVTLAWIAIALLLACGAIFQAAGGIYDYRIDFSAHCLYAICLCLLIQTRAFSDTRIAIIVGLVGAWLVSMRYFVVIYLFAIYAVLLLAAVAVALRSSGSLRWRAMLRLRNLFLSGGIIAIIVLPQLLLASRSIYNYYIVGHVLNEEKYVRAAEMGISSFLGHVLFYPASVWFAHFGAKAFWIAGALAVAIVISSLLFKSASPRHWRRRAKCFRFDFLALGAAIVAPLFVLSINISKSPVVGGVVIGPLLLLMVLLAAIMTPRGERRISVPIAAIGSGHAVVSSIFTASHQRLTARRVMAALCVVATVFGLAAFVRNGTVSQHYMSFADLTRVNELNRRIAHWIVDEGGSKAVVSIDRIADYLNRLTIHMAALEEFHQRLEIESGFGDTLFAIPRVAAMALLQGNDVIVLTDPKLGREAPYPLNTKIREYWDEMRAWTIENYLPFYTTTILGIPHTVFVRPSAAIKGLSAGWIVSDGVTIESRVQDLARWPFIVLEGQAHYDVLGGVPRPKAVVIDASGQSGSALDAKLTPNGPRYTLAIDTRAAELPKDDTLKIKLTFDRFFVPKQLGINPDTRELVLMAPSRHALSASPLR